MKNILTFLIILLTFNGLLSQTINVLDRATLQPVPGAVIMVKEGSLEQTSTTDQSGKVSTKALGDEAVIIVRALGYHTFQTKFNELKKSNYRILLTGKVYDLDETVISASRFEEKREDVPQQVLVMKRRDLELLSQPTTAELLQKSGEVLVQKSQLGGGSPILRGLEANKVLLVVDGIRMNNAIYRGGHLQSIITLDNSALEKAEVVYGPGSVIYGSDALGGVMHFHTLKPRTAGPDKSFYSRTQAFTRYSSAYNEKTAHADVNLGWKNWASLTSVTVSDFGDLRQGDVRNPFYGDWGKCLFYVERINNKDSALINSNPNIQKRSGYSQYDFMQKFYLKASEKAEHTLNFQYSTSSDINRYDRLTETSGGLPRYAEWYYGPQKRLLAAYHLDLHNSRIYDQARITLAWQNLEESRHNRSFGKSKLSHRTEKVDVLSLNADFQKQVGRHELRYGVEGTYNDVNSSAYWENIKDGSTGSLDTRYPDGGSTMRTLAVYFTHAWEITPKVILTDGLRYSNVYLNAKFNDTTFFPFLDREVTQKSGALNGNLGLIWKPERGWKISLLGSTGFRAPNVDDLGKVFESVPGSVIVPNPDLKSEYSWNGELSVAKNIAGIVDLEATGFYTHLTDLITVKPALVHGQDSIYYDGTLSRVTTSVNADKAYFYGVTGKVVARITPNFSLSSVLTYTYGRIKTDTTDYPLDHIPPVYGKTSMHLILDRFTAEFYALYNGWKRLEDYNLLGEDNIKYATQYGTPAWYTLNLNMAWQMNKYLQVQLALENILDQNYRVFASGISAPGRNLIVTLRGRF